MPFPYKAQQAQVPYGLHIPYDQGYDARSRSRAPTADQKGSSGYLLRPDGAQIALWITDITADFSLSGTQGQSRMLREFFPHSFNDVTLQISGNVASTQEYNRLALFVREHHYTALQAINNGGSADQTITFALYNAAAGRAPYSGTARTSDVVVRGESASSGLRNVKGPHRPWTVNGYISSIAAGAVRHEVAPEFSLGLIVTASTFSANTGIWSDTPDNQGSQLKTILQLLGTANHGKKTQGNGFIQNPIVTPAAPKPTSTKSVGGAIKNTYLTWSTQSAATTLGSLL